MTFCLLGKMPPVQLPKGNRFRKTCKQCGEIQLLKTRKCSCGFDFHKERCDKRLHELEKKVQQGKSNRAANNSTRMIAKAKDTVRYIIFYQEQFQSKQISVN